MNEQIVGPFVVIWVFVYYDEIQVILNELLMLCSVQMLQF